MTRTTLRPAVACVSLLCSVASGAGKPPAGAPVTILDGSGVWRALYSWGPPLLRMPDGLRERRSEARNAKPVERADFHFMTRRPPAGWTGGELDDSSWARRHFFVKYANGETDVRAGGGCGSPCLRQLSLRGKFTVTDPAAVGPMGLTIACRGGVAVWLNGKELTRAHLPAGKIEPGSPAETYPDRAYVKPNGRPWHWWNDRVAIAKEAYPLRVRRIEKLPVPKELLLKGVNVLAVEIHASAYPEAFAKAWPEWGTCGLVELRLQADGVGGIVPNVVRPRGVQAWNTSTAEQLYDVSWSDPHEALGPVVMAGARNGLCSGRVVVSSDQALEGLRAEMSPLAGPGGAKLPPSAVQVGYGRLDSPRGSRWGGGSDFSGLQWGQLPRLRDDAVLASPPAVVPVSAKAMPYGVADARLADGLPATLRDGAVQTVWLLAEVPKDAAPGEYRGTLTLTLGGQEPMPVPVRLRVIDWSLPDPADFTYWMGMIQCPEALALHYGVGLWSPGHCELIAQSLQWIGKLGGKVLYIPLGAESQYGNEQSMAVWVKGADGTYTHDLSRVQEYVDLALKHMGRPTFVVLGVWDSCSHVSAPKHLRRDFPRFTVRDAATGAITTADGPVNGTPQSLAFWRPVLTGVKDILAKRGLAEAMLLGFCADRQPDKATVEVFRQILPPTAWQATRHPPNENDRLPCEGGTVPIRYQANVWGGWDNCDPDTRRVYGWQHPADPSYRTWLDRGLFDACSIAQFLTAPEQALLAERHGLGQIGADFWPVPSEGRQGTHTMVGRFPATSEGNLGIYSGQLLYAGPRGPRPTVRYLMVRQNIQECEARIFLEKLLLAKPPRLAAQLARKIQDVLDARTRWHRMQLGELAPETYISWPHSGWEARSAELYEAAAEAARALAGP